MLKSSLSNDDQIKLLSKIIEAKRVKNIFGHPPLEARHCAQSILPYQNFIILLYLTHKQKRTTTKSMVLSPLKTKISPNKYTSILAFVKMWMNMYFWNLPWPLECIFFWNCWTYSLFMWLANKNPIYMHVDQEVHSSL